MEDANLRAALGYRRYQGPIRALVFDTGYLVVRDVLDAAQDLGWAVQALPTQREGRADGGFIGDLLKALVVHRPDFIITINHLGFDETGVLAGLLENYHIPVASWFVDHPFPVIGGARSNVRSNMTVFCFERTALPWLSREGYCEPIYLPTGANRRYYHPDRIDAQRAMELKCPLSFVGNSWWTKARSEPPDWARKAAQDILKHTASKPKGKGLGFVEAVERMTLKTPRPRDKYYAAGVAMAEASMQRRKRFAEALQPLGLVVHGDANWKQLVKGIHVRAQLDSERSLPALFAGTEINTNVSAEQMPTALNQRVWDVPACGGFLVTDAQDDVFEHFTENEDIVVYRGCEELVDKVRYFKQHPGERCAISRRAFEIVDQNFRMSHRLERMAEVMRGRWA